MEARLDDTVLIDTIRSGLGGGKPPVFMHLAALISKEIASGNLPRGVKLPPYRTMSHELGLAAGTVQRAYRELERQSMIVPRTGDGSYVLGPSPRERKRFRNDPEGLEPNRKNLAVADLARDRFMLDGDLGKWAKVHDMSDMDPELLLGMLNYADERGLRPHREAGAEWMLHHGGEVHPDNVFCTNGSQHGIHLAMSAFMRMHDTIAVDEYTYPGPLALAQRMGIRTVVIGHDEEGMLADDLERKIGGNRISAIYTTPTLQNPLNYRMPDKRRDEIAAICQRHKVFIIEDECQGILLERPCRSFYDRLPGQTARVSGMSKSVAAGLRVGYLAVPGQSTEQFRAAMKDTTLMATPLSHEMARRCVASGFAHESLKGNRLEIARRRKLVDPVLDGVEYSSAEGSPHYWISLMKKLTDIDVVDSLARKNIHVRPSSQFHSGHGQTSCCVRASINVRVDDEGISSAFAEIREFAMPKSNS